MYFVDYSLGARSCSPLFAQVCRPMKPSIGCILAMSFINSNPVKLVEILEKY